MKRIAVTIGDPAGIGPELIVRVLPDCVDKDIRFTVFGRRDIFESCSGFIPRETERFFEFAESGELSLVDVAKTVSPPPFGAPSRGGGAISFDAVRRAAADALSGNQDALVTAPICKESWHLAEKFYPGHTEFLAEVARVKNFAMAFVGDRIKLVLVTVHIPLKYVSNYLTKELIISKVSLASEFFKGNKIFVSGLNPHAGEGGILGTEERNTIEPAIAELCSRGVDVKGPFPTDTLFTPPMLEPDRVFIAMYHDQGLIPVKLLSFGKAVNLTLGLPFLRTSPDHGTAFDIAGQGKADISSFRKAVEFAIKKG